MKTRNEKEIQRSRNFIKFHFGGVLKDHSYRWRDAPWVFRVGRAGVAPLMGNRMALEHLPIGRALRAPGVSNSLFPVKSQAAMFSSSAWKFPVDYS